MRSPRDAARIRIPGKLPARRRACAGASVHSCGVDAVSIAASASVGLLLLALIVVVLRTRRRTRRLMAAGADAERESREHAAAAAAADQRAATVRIGEREAAWAARTAVQRARRIADRADALQQRLALAERSAVAAEGAVDDLRETLRRAEADTAAAEQARSEAEERVAALETEAAAAARALREARADADRLRSHPGADPAETAALRDRIEALETALAAARNGRDREGLPPDPWGSRRPDGAAADAGLEGELAEARRRLDEAQARLAAAAAGDPEAVSIRARLAAREAEVRDLGERLAALTAARHAEITRLTERIAAMERLYGEVERRDHQIADLESALMESGSALDRVRAEVETLRTELARAREESGPAPSAEGSAALARAEDRVDRLGSDTARRVEAEVRQLRELLAAERARNARLARRGGATPETEHAVAAAVAPLRAEIARLEAALRPAPTPVPTDVKLIKGIGPVIARILAGQGITTLEQVAGLGDAEIDALGPLLPVYPGRIRDDGWVEQARRLIAGG